jgi:hypothetical protein
LILHLIPLPITRKGNIEHQSKPACATLCDTIQNYPQMFPHTIVISGSRERRKASSRHFERFKAFVDYCASGAKTYDPEMITSSLV